MFKTRKSGILLHISSLPSPFGVGDFGAEAYAFVERLHEAKQTLWQILPLCPVDAGGSPYQSTSAFAGEPLYISLELLVKDGLLPMEAVEGAKGGKFYHTAYQEARRIKIPLLRTAFENFITCKKSREYESFVEKNKFWLEDYALFMALKEYFLQKRECESGGLVPFLYETKEFLTEEKGTRYFNSACWCSFPKEVRHREEKALREWRGTLEKEIAWQYFLQYQFQKQWQTLKHYANDHGIQIIGDAPIFVSYDSADVWANQKGFLLNPLGFPKAVAGVPPDYFSETGQLWGNPLYAWRYHEKNGFAWWISRMGKALEDVDFLRIDHFRGFEAFWEIPSSAEDARSGKWVTGPGMKLFRKLEKELGKLPFIAEDLGIITPEVKALREKAGLPGMSVLQFAFGQEKNHPYLPHSYDKNIVVYTGTHDNNTTVGWYADATEEERDHFRRYMNTTGEAPHWDLIRLAFSSPAQAAIVPLQDVLGLDADARMNQPGTTKENWKFQFRWEQWNDGCIEGLRYLSALFGRNED